MKRQFLGWGLRTLMLIGKFVSHFCSSSVQSYFKPQCIKFLGAFMAYRNPSLLPDCMEQGPYQFSFADNFWPTCGYLLAFFYLFKIA